MSRQTCICLALVMVLGAFTPTIADSVTSARLTFARPPAPESTVDPTDRLAIDIDRWSTDAERDRVRTVMAEHGTTRLLDAFRDTGRVGTLRWPGGLEYTVRYARQAPRGDGATDVVLILERPLWVWWQADAPSAQADVTVVQLSLDRRGVGDGRASLGGGIEADASLGVRLANGAAVPVALHDVRRDRPAT
jgi:hypothetical protein